MDFEKAAKLFETLENASSRLEMTSLLAEFFEKTPESEIPWLIYLLQGQLGPSYESINVGMGENYIEESIAKISGYPRKEVNATYKKLGDLGLVAQELISKKKQRALFSEKLSLKKVFANLLKIAKASGRGSQELKIKLLAELLNSASPLEAKFITRVPMERLRLGVGDPTFMDAFAINLISNFEKFLPKEFKQVEKQLKEKKEEKRKEELARKAKMRIRELIEEKYNIKPDLGFIAELLKKKGLKGLDDVKIEPGIPIRPTLAERLPSAKEIVKKLGKCAVEAKYDGFRIQIHKKGDKIRIFSRKMEEMTPMFPEVVEGIKKQVRAKDAIIEGEALAFNEQSEEFQPFQVTIQRKRKYEIKKMAEEFPLKLFVFDVMYLEGKNVMGESFKERRKILDGLIAKGDAIELTKSITTDNPEEIDEFFEENVEKGLEGIIAKDLNASYIAGARKFAWIKLKRSYKGELTDSVDVAIIGYFKGKGKRTKFGLGALLTAIYNKKSDSFQSIAKIGTGMKEDDLTELEKILSKIQSKGKPARVECEIKPDFWVLPKYVIEVIADEITKSPMHTAAREKEAGLALRFPRMIKLRSDKTPEQATTAKEVVSMFKAQKHVKAE